MIQLDIQSGVGQKIQLHLPVLLGIWLYLKTSNSLRLCNPGWNGAWTISGIWRRPPHKQHTENGSAIVARIKLRESPKKTHTIIAWGKMKGIKQIRKSLNSSASGWFQGISKKKRLNACGFVREFSGPVCSTDPVKVSKHTASLLVCTRKKIFCLRVRVFCEWCLKWKTYRPPWPTLPGPRRQPLGYFAEVLTENLATIRVFWYFGWPAGVSGWKVVMYVSKNIWLIR